MVRDEPLTIEPPPKELPQQEAESETKPEPPIPVSPSSTTNLLREAVRLFQLRFDAPAQSQRQRTERKLKQKITEKEQAHGLKHG